MYELNSMWGWAKVAGVCAAMSERSGLTDDEYCVLKQLASITPRQAMALAEAIKGEE